MSRTATLISSSENRSQRNASSKTGLGPLINDPPFPQRCVEYGSHDGTPARNLVRRGNDDVLLTGRSPSDSPYLHRSAALVRPVPHYHKQIHVARLYGGATGIGAEEHDASWLEPSDDSVHHG